MTRPYIRSEKLVGKTINLPKAAWEAMRQEAHALQITVNELIRRKLGV